MNISRYDLNVRVAAVAAVGLIALPGLMTTGRHGPPRPSGTPELTISVTDGQVAVRPGQTLTYQVTLRNTGAVAAARLEVTQTLAQGLEATSASGDGVVKAGAVGWSTAAPADSTRTFRVTARVTRPPAQVMELAAVACAALPGSSQPLVCAAHLDRLPVLGSAARPARPARPSGMGLLPYAVAAVTLLGGGAGAILLRRLRRGQSHRVTVRPTAPAPGAPSAATPDANHREFT